MERLRMQEKREVRLGNYTVLDMIGSGSFGDIYLGVDARDGTRVAIKVESTQVRCPQLEFERRVYGALQNAPGLPIVRNFYKEPSYRALVMDLLGPSLESQFNFCSRAFTVKTVLLLANQVLRRLEYIHSRGIVHRDIKPDNLLLGLGGRSQQLYLIDFGLAKKVLDVTTGVHLAYREGRHLTGTARYASINAHRGVEQSRRDDLISAGFMFVYFLRGSLPWQGIRASTKQQKYERILEVKESTNIEEMCNCYPCEFAIYLNYVRGLGFYEQPDYVRLSKMFRNLHKTLYSRLDYMFDWEILKLKAHHSQRNPGVGKRFFPVRVPCDEGASGWPIVVTKNTHP